MELVVTKPRLLLIAAMAVLALVFSLQSSAPARAAGLSFAAQAERAGLDSQQAKALQSKVDHYLKTMGGSQVSANEIDFKGGKLTVALPGEAHPRDFTSGAGRLAATDHCAHYYDANGYFCAYEGSNFTGDELQWSACGVVKNINFHHGGSWRNNQTRDQVATMYDKDWNVLKSSLAPEKDANGDWYHVWHMQLC